MLRWGNERANAFWEAAMPPGTWQKMCGACRATGEGGQGRTDPSKLAPGAATR
jgi:hypothetical protein